MARHGLGVTRRELALGAISGVALGGAARADDTVAAGAATLSAFDAKPMQVLRHSRKLFIASYRLGVVVRGGAFAATRGGGATSTTTVQLAGVSVEMLQAIAAQAEADLRAQLTAAGREVGAPDALKASAEFAAIAATRQPFAKSPMADARLVVQVAPTGRDLLLTAADSPLTDKSPFDQASARAMQRASFELSGILLTPQLVIDFSQVSGSGVSSFGGSASTSVKPGLYLVPLFTNLQAHFGKTRFIPDFGRGNLNKRILLGQAGEFVKTQDFNNRAAIADWNAQVALGTAAPGRMDGYSNTTYQYVVDPQQFAQTCLVGAQAYNRIFAEAATRFAPA